MPIQDKEQLLFVVFCIENVAAAMGVDGREVYRDLAKRSDILSGYIVPSYDVLHTQGGRYVVDDIMSLMRKRGVIA